jgi:hypothetical protein
MVLSIKEMGDNHCHQLKVGWMKTFLKGGMKKEEEEREEKKKAKGTNL